MNKTQLYGRVAADPELRYTQSGTPVLSFPIAVRRNYKNREGQYETDFLDCVVWRKPAEILAHSLMKGHRIVVSGRIETSRYQDNEGNTRRKWEIVVEEWTFVETVSKANSNDSQNGSGAYQDNPSYAGQQQAPALTPGAPAPAGNYGNGSYGGPVVAPDEVPF